MKVFLNGELVPESEALVSVFDRGFLYGDGLFETIRICNAKPFRWAQHVARLQRGAEFLRISIPLRPDELLSQAARLIDTNQMSSALLRITLSRGIGVRGYSTKGADRPTLVMATHPAAVLDTDLPRWRLNVSRFRVPAGEPLASFKTCNKLPQILARAEAEHCGADEALLLNTHGELAEAASSNLFWIEQENVCTTSLATGILAGVMRDLVFELCSSMGSQVEEKRANLETLRQAAGVFLTTSSLGVVEATELDGQTLATSNRVHQLQAAYLKALHTETR